MGHTIYSQIGLVLLLICCGLAWWKGDPAERWGGVLILVMNVLADAISFWGGKNFPYFSEFLIDLALAVGLLILAVRYSNLWLGFAMLLQGLALAWYAYQASADVPQRHMYAHWVNILTTLMLLSIVAGTIVSWRRRARQVKAATSPDPAPAPTSLAV